MFYAEIYRSDLKRVCELAQECGIELKYAEYETLSAKLLRYRKRIGIFIGVLAAAAVVFYFSGVVVTIDIQGNSSVSDEVIISALEELDIKQGTAIRDIDFKYCENKLRVMVNGIAWAGIRHTGNRVVVEVTELVEKPEMLNERMPCNVIASKSAEITYTSVYDGMLMRIVGDHVRAGDMLISGVTEDSTGHVVKHHAMGKILGKYEENVVFSESFVAETYLPTGETTDENYLKLFNLQIPLFFGKNDYETEIEETAENDLKVFGKTLPIGIVHKNRNETKLSVREYTPEELEECIMEKIYLYEQNFLGDSKIIEREISSEQTEESLTYTVKYVIEGEIGEQREIFIK